jgi:hypothetical protein
MSRTIRVSAEVFEAIRSKGKMGDTPDDVIRRMLGLGPDSRGPNKRMKSVQVTPARFFEPYVLKVLLGCADHVMRGADVVKAIGPQVMEYLKPADFQPHKRTGGVRWKACVGFARISLTGQGFIEPSSESGHGFWKLTDEGIKAALKLK